MDQAAYDPRYNSRWFRWRWAKHKCWRQTGTANEIGGYCRKFAWLESWTGWRWCFKHWYEHLRHGGGHKWFEIRNVKIIL